MLRRRVCLLVMASLALGTEGAMAATARTLYVDQFAGTSNAVAIRQAVARELKRSGAFEVTDTPSAADLILGGTNRLRIRGYVSLNPRSGILPEDGKPVYGGYLSVELKDRTGVTVWSYLAVPPGGSNALEAVAKDVAKHLAAAMASKR